MKSGTTTITEGMGEVALAGWLSNAENPQKEIFDEGSARGGGGGAAANVK